MKRLLAVLVVLAVVAAAYLFVYDAEYSGSEKAERNGAAAKGPLVFSHRGFGDHGPDNSLAAAYRAMAAGFDGVDVDAQLTKDGKVVVFHDLSLERLTDAHGKVGNYTLAELEKLDLAKKFDAQPGDKPYTKAPVQSFETFVENIATRGILMVELKVTEKGDTGMEREVVRILKKHDAFDRVYLSSFNPLVIRRLESLDARVRSVFIFMDTNWNAELLAEMNPEDVVDLPWFLRKEWTRRAVRKLIRPDLLSVNVEVAEQTREHLIDAGWPVLLWAPNDKVAIDEAIAEKPFGIISDEPELVRKRLARESSGR